MTTGTLTMTGVKSHAAHAEAKTSAPARIAYLDTLKIALTALVIAHHAGQAYGPTGGLWPIFSPERSPILGPFFGVNAAFFMGLFFFISGYVLPLAYDRKGAATFLRDRVRRLGIPLLLFALLVGGPLLYLGQDHPRTLGQFIAYVYPGNMQSLIGHLWFVAHLLVYSLAYALWRILSPRFRPAAAVRPSLPTYWTLLGYAALLSLATGIVRIWYPIDRWETLVIVPAELAHLPQYASMFLLGILACRGDWLRRLPASTGMIWLGIGLAAAAAWYARDLSGHDWLAPLPWAVGGLLENFWEALVCVGMSVGLLTLFRERFSGQPGRWLTVAAGAAYGAYVVHVMIVVGLQAGLEPVTLSPFAKFALVSLAGIPLSFGIATLLRRIPGAKKVL